MGWTISSERHDERPTYVRALVVCTPNGNVLWDCIAMLDPATITLIFLTLLARVGTSTYIEPVSCDFEPSL